MDDGTLHSRMIGIYSMIIRSDATIKIFKERLKLRHKPPFNWITVKQYKKGEGIKTLNDNLRLDSILSLIYTDKSVMTGSKDDPFVVREIFS